MRDVFKGSVSSVAKKLVGTTLVGDKQIEESIIVDIGPNSRLGGSRRLGQPAGAGHIGEGAVAVISQQRAADRVFPSSTEHQDIHATVVVVIRLDDVQPA